MYIFVYFAALFVVSCNAVFPVLDSANIKVDPVCKRRNQYVSIDGNCDSYIECRDYHAIDRECPDGLHYNVDAKWPQYPCGYPSDVPCRGRGIQKAPEPTADCPHQFGFFPSPLAQANDCGHYRMCVGGRAFEMYCPTGLSFSPDTGRCDWPENVPSCKISSFLGYECPPATYDEEGYPIITNHKYGNNCYAFYMCESGKARLLSCDPGFAFDEVSGHCVDEDLVPCHLKVEEAIPL
ncbi:protein obstructor-E-like [Danaus plexippus]|uniref:protein obstructor-E-like n=1 Tax=Danaus plexippus TaxID=13037 RepID=UPI002AB28D19|nr:protein obstructor-E-like [Danaus plexippus]